MQTHAVDAAQIGAVRRFNRFHTRVVGALGERMLATRYSLPQLRVLYEVAQAPAGVAAAELARALAIDAGYLSRLITRLEGDGLLARERTPGNAKRLALRLTASGRKLFKRLDAASSKEVTALLQHLPEGQQAQLVAAMAQVQRLLGDLAADPPAQHGVTLREPQAGDMGAIVRGHGLLYANEYGWDWTFEAFVAEIVATFVQNFDPSAERCWVAERDGQVVGSVFVVRDDAETAKLRMLYVDAGARGLGLGHRLVDEAIDFARACGYRQMRLWTNDLLAAARRIYEARGFVLVEEAPHHSFGHDLIGQVWLLRL